MSMPARQLGSASSLQLVTPSPPRRQPLSPEETAVLYSDGSPALDPRFVALRREHFDPAQRWLHVDSALRPVLASVPMGMAMLGSRCLTSAFGWEQRPWLERGQLDAARSAALLEKLNSLGSWEACEINMLTDGESRELREACARTGNACLQFGTPIRVIQGKPYEQYFAELSQHTRKYWRQQQRRFAAGGFELRRQLEWESIEKLLDIKRMKHPKSGDYTKNTDFRAFWRAYREELRKDGRLQEVGIFKNG